MPIEMKRSFVAAMSELSSLTFIWKYEVCKLSASFVRQLSAAIVEFERHEFYRRHAKCHFAAMAAASRSARAQQHEGDYNPR